MSAEEKLISLIRTETESKPELTARLLRGIGDDAAILKRFPGNLAVTTDLLCDGVDFICGKNSPEEIGRKSLAVNLSDLAAMGAVPLAVVVSVVLPRRFSGETPLSVPEFAARFSRGMTQLAARFRVSMAGGDTNSWNGAFAVSITAMGAVPAEKALCRTGAKPGDRILLTGSVGGSIFRRQFQFHPRILEALYLSSHHDIHGAIDISDGLELDLSRMARESGVGYRLALDAVPIHADALNPPPNAQDYPGWKTEKLPIRHALEDGEDFELILAVPPDEAKRLVEEQPFLRAAEGESVYRDRLRNLCEEHGFAFTPKEIDLLHEVKLTDIGEFAAGEVPSETDSGWQYSF